MKVTWKNCRNVIIWTFCLDSWVIMEQRELSPRAQNTHAGKRQSHLHSTSSLCASICWNELHQFYCLLCGSFSSSNHNHSFLSLKNFLDVLCKCFHICQPNHIWSLLCKAGRFLWKTFTVLILFFQNFTTFLHFQWMGTSLPMPQMHR